MADNDSEQTTGNDAGAGQPAEFALVREVLESAGLTAEPLKGSLPGYRIDFMDDGPNVGGVALILAEQSRFVFFLEFLDRGVEEHRAAVAEFIARVNFTLTVGSFDLNYDTVEVRFKVAVDYAGDELRDVFVRTSIVNAMEAVENYADLLFEVMKGEKPAKDAADEGLARAQG